MAENENENGIQIDTWNVPHFEWKLPLMKTLEGQYIPISAICEMLGINPTTYTGVACRRYKPSAAVRKLPVRRGAGAPQMTWCLSFESALSWLWGFNTRKADPARRPALLALQEEMTKVTAKAYEKMQEQFKSTRQIIYRRLLECEQMLANFADTADKVRSWPVASGDPSDASDAARAAFRALLEEGTRTYTELAEALRIVLAEMTRGPVIDALKVDDDNNVIDTMAMPLLPVIPDLRKVNVQMRRVEAWSHSFRAFALEQGMPDDHGAPD